MINSQHFRDGYIGSYIGIENILLEKKSTLLSRIDLRSAMCQLSGYTTGLSRDNKEWKKDSKCKYRAIMGPLMMQTAGLEFVDEKSCYNLVIRGPISR